MNIPIECNVGAVFIQWDGEHYELSYQPRKDSIELERRTLAKAFRQLADRFDDLAREVGD